MDASSHSASRLSQQLRQGSHEQGRAPLDWSKAGSKWEHGVTPSSKLLHDLLGEAVKASLKAKPPPAVPRAPEGGQPGNGADMHAAGMHMGMGMEHGGESGEHSYQIDPVEALFEQMLMLQEHAQGLESENAQLRRQVDVQKQLMRQMQEQLLDHDPRSESKEEGAGPREQDSARYLCSRCGAAEGPGASPQAAAAVHTQAAVHAHAAMHHTHMGMHTQAAMHTQPAVHTHTAMHTQAAAQAQAEAASHHWRPSQPPMAAAHVQAEAASHFWLHSQTEALKPGPGPAPAAHSFAAAPTPYPAIHASPAAHSFSTAPASHPAVRSAGWDPFGDILTPPLPAPTRHLDAPAAAPSWSCSACTYEHSSAEALFLKCAVCGALR